jgi:UDP-N-acetylmuramate dehydrogenase
MIKLKEDILLAPHTYYKIGGPARFFVDALTLQDMREALRFAVKMKLPYFVLGNGSNILISDKGFPGLVIKSSANNIAIDGSRVTVDAGVSMARAVAATVAAGLIGIEWAIGIPGALGGSVRGNAGCFGGEMKDTVRAVRVYDAAKDEERLMDAKDCKFQYRESIFKHHPELAILSAVLQLSTGGREASQKMIAEFAKKRADSQAIGSKSAGCIFKNILWDSRDIDKLHVLARFPELAVFLASPAIPAAYCIEAAGLKGRRAGDVEISQRHANYFVNLGKATADDVVRLIKITKQEVESKFGLKLQEEIQYIGF